MASKGYWDKYAQYQKDWTENGSEGQARVRAAAHDPQLHDVYRSAAQTVIDQQESLAAAGDRKGDTRRSNIALGISFLALLVAAYAAFQ